jgi:3'-phosphoadenosine 5'-phosphosulfate sulfotransferase (PAPS reductase)/FAD synthetase
MYLQRKINQSISIIENMLSICPNSYLSLSFGKDSLALLHLIMQVKKDIPCLFLASEETFLLENYDEIINHYIEKGVNIKVVNMKHLNYNFEGGANNEFKQSEFLNFDGVFMGLRIEESKARKISLIKKENNVIGKRIMQYKSGDRKNMYRCCPISEWSSFEIFVYCQENNIKLLDAYTSHEIRTSAQLNYSGTLTNQINDLKARNISAYNKLIVQIPHLKMYV